MEDLVKPHFPAMTEARATLLSKALGQLFESPTVHDTEAHHDEINESNVELVSPPLAMSYGLLCLAMAYLTHLMGDSVLQVISQPP